MRQKLSVYKGFLNEIHGQEQFDKFESDFNRKFKPIERDTSALATFDREIFVVSNPSHDCHVFLRMAEPLLFDDIDMRKAACNIPMEIFNDLFGKKKLVFELQLHDHEGNEHWNYEIEVYTCIYLLSKPKLRIGLATLTRCTKIYPLSIAHPKEIFTYTYRPMEHVNYHL